MHLEATSQLNVHRYRYISGYTLCLSKRTHSYFQQSPTFSTLITAIFQRFSIIHEMEMTRNDRVKMLQASIDEEYESHFRFLVDRTFVKYITIDVGLFSTDDLAFAPVLLPLLPQFPPGDWNIGRISKDLTTGEPVFSELAKESLQRVHQTWHNTFIDILDLPMDQKIRSNVYRVTHPKFTNTVIAKFATFLWEVDWLDDETRAYRWIDGTGIGPGFLGHLTEEGRVIGFLLEDLSEARHSEPKDILLCQEVVSRLHKMGIRHGDLNKHNILISDGRAVLIDFDVAQKCDDGQALQCESEALLANLEDESGKGGCIIISQAPDGPDVESIKPVS